MADRARFPQLALPFAIAGGAAGWLSAKLLANPLVAVTRGGKEWLASLCVLGIAAVAGAVLTHWCRGTRYSYELVASDTVVRARTDTWLRQVAVVLASGVASGVLLPMLCETYGGAFFGAINGFFFSIPFIPVCAAVIAAGRRSQRARLGSIVAASDRRAVVGILAVALSVASLEGVLEWPAWAMAQVYRPSPFLMGHLNTPWPLPFPIAGLLVGAALVTFANLVGDARARARVRAAIALGLERHERSDMEASEALVPRLDLGLGDALSVRFARKRAVYRARDRAVALVEGDGDQAVAALSRALRRGGVALAVIASVSLLHLAATTQLARVTYAETFCGRLKWPIQCNRAGMGLAVEASLHVDSLDPSLSESERRALSP